ncbi:ADP-ribosylation/Crystallin J1 [Crassisporium funariophilum]|nr:ADP-ribosylation/Crystallin J1 [Crassisporium funariophilum]
MPPFWTSKSKAKKYSEAEPRSGGSRIPKSPTPDPSTLRGQYPRRATSACKIRLTLLSTACVDALGGPAEFQKRFSFPFVSSMIPNENFGLPAGVFTDDTSMTLCLANSISTFKETPESTTLGGFDEVDQLQEYRRWQMEGHLSAVGKCFDIGATISRALQIFGKHDPADPQDTERALHRIRSDLGGEQCSGNGSLMRIIPIGLAYWRDEDQAKTFARRSSEATHPSLMCVEACQMWVGAIVRIMQETTDPRAASSDSDSPPFSKLTLLDYISTFGYTSSKLHAALAVPFGVSQKPDQQSPVELENWYFRHHPLLRLINDTQGPPGPAPIDGRFAYSIPPADQLPSSGFVLHTVVAALYCFFATKTFEEGALMAVNLGDDADTIGAVYAGLAACWYAGEEGKAEGIFWTKKVREWRKALVRRDMVEQVAEKLVVFERRLAEEDM